MNVTPRLKSMPLLPSDADAEAFVATADLSEYDLSGFKPARFVLDAPATQSAHDARKTRHARDPARSGAGSY